MIMGILLAFGIGVLFGICLLALVSANKYDDE
jgi:hypothetical protein